MMRITVRGLIDPNTWLYLVGIFSAIVLFEPSPMEVSAVTLSVFALLQAKVKSVPRAIFCSVFLFLYLNILSIVFSDQIGFAIYSSLIRIYLFVFLIILSGVIASTDDASIHKYLSFLIIGALVNGVLILIVYITDVEFMEFVYRDNFKYRFKGLFKDPNVLGAHLVFALTLLFYVDWNRTFKAMAALVLIAALILTYSRASWAGLILVPAVYYVLVCVQEYKFNLKRGSILIVVAVICLIIFAAIVLPMTSFDKLSTIDYALSRLSLQSYDSKRFFSQAETLGLILHHPFGYGPGSTVRAAGGLTTFNDPHNVYLKIAAESGVVSLLVYLFVVFYIALLARWLGKNGNHLGYILLANHLYFGLLGFVIDTIHWRVTIIVWALIVGLYLRERALYTR